MSNSCSPVDCSPPDYSVYGISQARKLEWLPFPFPGGLPNPRIKSVLSALAGRFFTTEPPGKLILVNRCFQNWRNGSSSYFPFTFIIWSNCFIWQLFLHQNDQITLLWLMYVSVFILTLKVPETRSGWSPQYSVLLFFLNTFGDFPASLARRVLLCVTSSLRRLRVIVSSSWLGSLESGRLRWPGQRQMDPDSLVPRVTLWKRVFL